MENKDVYETLRKKALAMQEQNYTIAQMLNELKDDRDICWHPDIIQAEKRRHGEKWQSVLTNWKKFAIRQFLDDNQYKRGNEFRSLRGAHRAVTARVDEVVQRLSTEGACNEEQHVVDQALAAVQSSFEMPPNPEDRRVVECFLQKYTVMVSRRHRALEDVDPLDEELVSRFTAVQLRMRVAPNDAPGAGALVSTSEQHHSEMLLNASHETRMEAIEYLQNFNDVIQNQIRLTEAKERELRQTVAVQTAMREAEAQRAAAEDAVARRTEAEQRRTEAEQRRTEAEHRREQDIVQRERDLFALAQERHAFELQCKRDADADAPPPPEASAGAGGRRPSKRSRSVEEADGGDATDSAVRTLAADRPAVAKLLQRGALNRGENLSGRVWRRLIREDHDGRLPPHPPHHPLRHVAGVFGVLDDLLRRGQVDGVAAADVLRRGPLRRTTTGPDNVPVLRCDADRAPALEDALIAALRANWALLPPLPPAPEAPEAPVPASEAPASASEAPESPAPAPESPAPAPEAPAPAPEAPVEEPPVAAPAPTPVAINAAQEDDAPQQEQEQEPPQRAAARPKRSPRATGGFVATNHLQPDRAYHLPADARSVLDALADLPLGDGMLNMAAVLRDFLEIHDDPDVHARLDALLERMEDLMRRVARRPSVGRAPVHTLSVGDGKSYCLARFLNNSTNRAALRRGAAAALYGIVGFVHPRQCLFPALVGYRRFPRTAGGTERITMGDAVPANAACALFGVAPEDLFTRTSPLDLLATVVAALPGGSTSASAPDLIDLGRLVELCATEDGSLRWFALFHRRAPAVPEWCACQLLLSRRCAPPSADADASADGAAPPLLLPVDRFNLPEDAAEARSALDVLRLRQSFFRIGPCERSSGPSAAALAALRRSDDAPTALAVRVNFDAFAGLIQFPLRFELDPAMQWRPDLASEAHAIAFLHGLALARRRDDPVRPSDAAADL